MQNSVLSLRPLPLFPDRGLWGLFQRGGASVDVTYCCHLKRSSPRFITSALRAAVLWRHLRRRLLQFQMQPGRHPLKVKFARTRPLNRGCEWPEARSDDLRPVMCQSRDFPAEVQFWQKETVVDQELSSLPCPCCCKLHLLIQRKSRTVLWSEFSL